MSTKSTKATPKATEEAVETQEDVILDDEFERLVPKPGEPITLDDGTKVIVRPLKLQELFAAFKIITRGSAMSMAALNMNVLDNRSEFTDTLVALLINAIPEAPEEFSEFLRVLVDPYVEGGKWESQEARLEAETHLDDLLLINPDIGDAIEILTTMIYIESRDIERLGKKISNAVKVFAKVTPKAPKN